MKGCYVILGTNYYPEEGFWVIVVFDPKKVIQAMRDIIEKRAFVCVRYVKEGQEVEDPASQDYFGPRILRDWERLVRIGVVDKSDPYRRPIDKH